MATLQGKCDTCACSIDMDIGQSVDNGNLTWHKAYSCPHCGAQREEDGRGPTPEIIRRAILQQEGIWALAVDADMAQSVLVLKPLRQALGLSLDGVLALRRRSPRDLVSGTKSEMERLREVLVHAGVQSTVLRASDTSGMVRSEPG